jgi:cytochrome c-type biogenesis protein CcmH
MKFVAKLLILLILSTNCYANLNFKQEQLAQQIFKQVRCVVCNGQTIAESDIELAKSMRLQIRNLIEEDFNQIYIERYLIDRYGEQVLTKPPVNKHTFFLWYGPYLILFIIIFSFITILFFKRKI